MSEDEAQQSEERESAHEDEDGQLHVDIEDAGGREIRDVNEEPPEDEVQEIEEERERRLDPDNRPEGAEVDNTHRTFDSETGMFTDNPEHDSAEPQFSPEAEPEAATSDDSSDSSDSADSDDSGDDSGSGEVEDRTDDREDEEATDAGEDLTPVEDQEAHRQGEDDVPAPATPRKHRADP